METIFRERYRQNQIRGYQGESQINIPCRNKEIYGLKKCQEWQNALFLLITRLAQVKAEGLFKKLTREVGWGNEEIVYQRKDGEKAYGFLSEGPILDEKSPGL